MSVSDYQYLFNLAFGLFQGLLLFIAGYLLTSLRGELARIHKRIDELRDANDRAHGDLRTDMTTCQRELPNVYLTRNEMAIVSRSIEGRLDRMEAMLARIDERLNQKCESLIKHQST